MTTQLIRPYSRRLPKAHLTGADGRPLCGGGRGGKTVQWQQDIGPANCARCQRIALGKNSNVSTPPR